MKRPNILLVVADDHAANAVGCYGGPHAVTPRIDTPASDGIRFTACGCTNSLCAPSRATILTGTYNHVDGVTTLSTEFDARQPSFPGLLRDTGYRGVRTRNRKLVHYYGSGCDQPGASSEERAEEWELFDLERDPREMHSVVDDPAYAPDLNRLRSELDALATSLGDTIPTTTKETA